MTIRRILLISYLLISLASALLITVMIFVHLQEILLKEIEDKLNSQAMTIMQQIDTTLYERMENMAMWSELDVMQEIRVGDVDKRLAHFLHELQTGYQGVYLGIFVTNDNNGVISASDPNMIGKTYTYRKPWLNVTDIHHTHELAPLDDSHNYLSFSIVIPDAVQKGKLGRLYANFDWREISKILSKHLSSGSYALLVDADDRVLATSDALDTSKLQFLSLHEKLQLETDAAGKFLDEDVLAGFARSEGYLTFKGYGWRVIILQARNTAFAKVWDLWITILEFLCLTLFLGIVVSFWMSAKIARPIVLLAGFTREFMQGKQTTPPQIKSSSEITELVTQFTLMINTLEQSRQDMVRVAKLAVIGEMAASMAHEVRTPLGILRSSAQMLQREAQLSEVGQEMTEFILSETERLNELVTTLLECARPRLPCKTQQDIQQIIRHTLDLVKSQAENKGVQLMTHFKDVNSLVYCDRDQLIQVFLNLVMNAIQHVAKGGWIEIITRSDDRQIEIWVCDNGIGISDTNKKNIFDPFFTRRQDGIGLGLTVVQQIILAHYGKISVTDSSAGGACFHIILPVNETPGLVSQFCEA